MGSGRKETARDGRQCSDVPERWRESMHRQGMQSIQDTKLSCARSTTTLVWISKEKQKKNGRQNRKKNENNEQERDSKLGTTHGREQRQL